MTLDEQITNIQNAYRKAFHSLAKREVAYKHEIANTHKRLETELRTDIETAIKEHYTQDTHADRRPRNADEQHTLDTLVQAYLTRRGWCVYRRDFL